MLSQLGMKILMVLGKNIHMITQEIKLSTLIPVITGKRIHMTQMEI